ncbi:toll/interleukin-1 receptor domain-containing protein [Telluribacter sp. SYSU D00476]|uniref:toll/interleukin-1 receptor domain-containing protein n=1 Tax=Telluribacter sp. SYSU D00476 TaxID=2811430 RepID=UPI001FF5E020|nr:toll/interleukin-1 receptor domain-containing protein [Telluribacter sp. SYSU D00476]
MLPIHKRPYHAFLSHAHADKAQVDAIQVWLREKAGLSVWYDTISMSASNVILSEIGKAIQECRSILIFLTKKSVESNWVELEYSIAHDQYNYSNKKFKIIPIILEECAVPSSLNPFKRINLINKNLDAETSNQLLLALYLQNYELELTKVRDVYISRSWREHEQNLPNFVCRKLADCGFRLIGDSEDQKGFKEGNRVEEIISSCGGLVAILPNRGAGQTSKYMLKEIELARSMSLPYLVVCEDGVEISDDLYSKAIDLIRINLSELDTDNLITKRLKFAADELSDLWQGPAKPHYVFFATNFDKNNSVRNQVIRRLIEHVTAMPCNIGERIREPNIQNSITQQIKNAFAVIADISNDNLNTCVEAGIALGADVNLHLVASSLPSGSKRPFMFRHQQIWHYENDAELIGSIHNIIYPYRRRIINYEI